MKKLSYVAGLALLAMTISHAAQADTIVDTGAPQGSGYSPLTFDGGDWLAAEFTTTQSWNIGSIEGYITDNGDTSQIGNTFTISVYDNNPSTNTPWLASEEYYGQATFTGDGWNGLTGISGLQLAAGAYWIAFEVGSNGNSDTFQGIMPVSTANPLTTAWYDGVSSSGYQVQSGAGYDIGVQISSSVAAVPLPSSLLMFVSGILALGRFGFGKRKAV
ncbi:MAG: hypothetical protein PHW13_05055 [Methylococcales bacterium]|nr:hypothetical protein [Methylococcales bacterium]